jgi:hypothetical protein
VLTRSRRRLATDQYMRIIYFLIFRIIALSSDFVF